MNIDPQISILGVRYNNITVLQAIESFIALMNKGQKATIFFLNADCLRQAQKDHEYKNCLDGADLLLSDGIGLKLVTTMYGHSMADNCNGTDLSPKFIEQCAINGWSIFLLGGKPGIAKKAGENLAARFQKLSIAGTMDGYFKDAEAVISIINASKADVLFVAMGVPAQEKFITQNRQILNPKACLGVGALFDYISESIPRAPQWMIKMHIEWFWRIFIDPKRMFKRYMIDGIGFMLWAIIKKYSPNKPK